MIIYPKWNQMSALEKKYVNAVFSSYVCGNDRERKHLEAYLALHDVEVYPDDSLER